MTDDEIKMQQLLEEMKQYIEETQVELDAEFGDHRSVEQLAAAGKMPPLYAKITAALANQAERRAKLK